LNDRYVLCPSGASMGDNYGPMVVAREAMEISSLRDRPIAVPGTWTSAFLALRLCLGSEFPYVVVPFDQILDAVEAGQYEGQDVAAGLIIHEGQLTYDERQLKLVVDLGCWWYAQTDGLSLPLGANGIRRDLGPKVIADVNRLLKESIAYGLQHREEALNYALRYGRDLDRSQAAKLGGTFVKAWTLDYRGSRAESVRLFLHRGYAPVVIPRLVEPYFSACAEVRTARLPTAKLLNRQGVTPTVLSRPS